MAKTKEITITYTRKFCVGSLDQGNFTTLEAGVSITISPNGDKSEDIFQTGFTQAKEQVLSQALGFAKDIQERNKNPRIMEQLTRQLVKELHEYQPATEIPVEPPVPTCPETVPVIINEPGTVTEPHYEDIVVSVNGKEIPAKDLP
jgi:hypothetical protein